MIKGFGDDSSLLASLRVVEAELQICCKHIACRIFEIALRVTTKAEERGDEYNCLGQLMSPGVPHQLARREYGRCVAYCHLSRLG